MRTSLTLLFVALSAGLTLADQAPTSKPTATVVAPPAAQASAAPVDPAARVLVLSRRLDRLYRAESSHGNMRMRVVTPNYERELTLEVWSRGMDDTLVRIKSPRKERGTATLKRGNEMWNYLPKIKRTIRIPASMMMGAWMGSDLTNDDLMRESSWEQDYDVALSPSPASGEVCLDYVPKPSAAVTWSKVRVCFDEATELPKAQLFFDEKGREARRITLDKVTEMGGRMLPARMTLVPLRKEGHQTVVEYEDMEFDVEHPANLFTLTRLRRSR